MNATVSVTVLRSPLSASYSPSTKAVVRKARQSHSRLKKQRCLAAAPCTPPSRISMYPKDASNACFTLATGRASSTRRNSVEMERQPESKSDAMISGMKRP